MLSDKVYTILKWLCLIFLPALTALIATLGQIYGWVDAEKVVLTINAVAAFIGAIIGVSSYKYNKKIGEDE